MATVAVTLVASRMTAMTTSASKRVQRPRTLDTPRWRIEKPIDDGQRRELYTLAMVSQTAELCPAARPLARAVAPTVTALLKRLGTTPAFVAGPANDLLAWNDAWEQLVRPLGMLDGAIPNLAR